MIGSLPAEHWNEVVVHGHSSICDQDPECSRHVGMDVVAIHVCNVGVGNAFASSVDMHHDGSGIGSNNAFIFADVSDENSDAVIINNFFGNLIDIQAPSICVNCSPPHAYFEVSPLRMKRVVQNRAGTHGPNREQLKVYLVQVGLGGSRA